MKYIIKESHLARIIFRYLDYQDFIQIEKADKIFFVNSKNDKDSKILYDKKHKKCYISANLVREISSFFSVDETSLRPIISRWVDNTLQMKVTTTIQVGL